MVSSRTEMLQTAERYQRLSHSLNVLASGPRAGFLLSLDALAPALVEIGGAEVARATAQFIVEAKTWWY